MSEIPKKSANEIDEELAEFTDRALSDQSLNLADTDAELRPLLETVSRLKATSQSLQKTAAAGRIEKRLTAEWQHTRNGPDKFPAWLKKILPGPSAWRSGQQRRLVLTFAALVFFLIVALPIGFVFTNNLQASAGAVDQYRPLLLIIAVVLIIGLLWFGRDKS